MKTVFIKRNVRFWHGNLCHRFYFLLLFFPQSTVRFILFTISCDLIILPLDFISFSQNHFITLFIFQVENSIFLASLTFHRQHSFDSLWIDLIVGIFNGNLLCSTFENCHSFQEWMNSMIQVHTAQHAFEWYLFLYFDVDLLFWINSTTNNARILSNFFSMKWILFL